MEQQKQNPSAPSPVKSVPDSGNPEKNQTDKTVASPIERGGRKGPEPTRYGDWELNGKCVDF
jgi:hypothetical protein